MNTLNYLARVADYLLTKDVARLQGNDKLTLLQAINSGIAKWNSAAPVSHRTHNDGVASFAAPRTVSVTVTENSQTFVCASITSADIGKTIILGGDGVPNTLLTATQFRIPYGGTTGTTTAVIYSDAYVLPANYEGIVGQVWWESTERRPLPLLPDLRRSCWFTSSSPLVGEPQGYGIEVGNTAAGGSAPRAIMRLYPFPGVLQRVSFDYFGPPQNWTMTDLSTVRELGFSDEHWQNMLRLTIAELLGTTLLREDVDINRIDLQAGRAEQDIRTAPVSPSPMPVRGITPSNW